jgi:selenocysteine lyase/cysteine desulfurase
MDVRAARQFFPGLAGCAFLDSACVSLAPAQAIAAVKAFADMTAGCAERDASFHHIAMDTLRGTAVREGARLLGADEAEIALVESTTHGLNIVAQAIPFEPQDNVVIADLEFLQVAIPWVKLQERGRIAEVRLARNSGGRLPVEVFEPLIDGRTRAVVVSSTQWSNGYRLDLGGLGRLCRERGVLFIVDAIQELGALELNVGELPIDILVAGGHKWLNSPFGCGLLWISPELLPRLQEQSWGYLGMSDPEGGWGTYFATPSISPIREYDFPATAKRFEIGGTSNYPGAAALGASLALVNEIGIGAVERHVRSLAARVRDGIRELGLELVTPSDPAAYSAITVFSAGSPEAGQELLGKLLDDRVLASVRYTSGVGGIRVSTHYFNDESDVDALLAAVRRHRPRAR